MNRRIEELWDYELIKNNLSDIKIERVKNNANPTIVILDEMNGFGGLNDQIINTKQQKKKTTLLKNLILPLSKRIYYIFKIV